MPFNEIRREHGVLGHLNALGLLGYGVYGADVDQLPDAHPSAVTDDIVRSADVDAVYALPGMGGKRNYPRTVYDARVLIRTCKESFERGVAANVAVNDLYPGRQFRFKGIVPHDKGAYVRSLPDKLIQHRAAQKPGRAGNEILSEHAPFLLLSARVLIIFHDSSIIDMHPRSNRQSAGVRKKSNTSFRRVAEPIKKG